MLAREAQFAALLDDTHLDSYAFKHSCLRGIPDIHRPEAWRCLLGVAQLHDRQRTKAQRRSQYVELVRELLAADEQVQPDEPARRPQQDVWLDDIDKDVRRTQTSYAFFSQHAPWHNHATSSIVSIPYRRNIFDRLDRMHPHRRKEIEERFPASYGDDTADSIQADRHFECLIRILYIFALLNPVHYVQGMSELAAPLYYVFAHSPSIPSDSSSQSQEAMYAEEDTFWAFSSLMAEFGDFFVQDSDGALLQLPDTSWNNTSSQTGQSRTGLGATLRAYAQELHWLDAELAYSLHRQKEIQPTFYALRWITTLFAMEVPIPDLVQIWDMIFALLEQATDNIHTPTRREAGTLEGPSAKGFVLDFCCAIVLMKRRELLSSNFSSCLQMLQNYVCDDIQVPLAVAFSIRERRITGSLTGLNIASYSSVPNSPAAPNDGFEDTAQPGTSVASTGLQSAKNMLSAAAESSAAKAFKSRFWRSPSKELPEDVPSETSIHTPAKAHSAHTPSGTPLSPSKRTSVNYSPAAASAMLGKYASTLAQSDAAASLSKATTNGYIAALQWKESAPSTIFKLRSDVSARVNTVAGSAKTAIRPPSPSHDPPFTPPTASTGRFLSPSSGQASLGYGTPTSVVSERRPSNGPKPLLLSSSARRASATSETLNISPSVSRRSSNAGLAGLPASMRNGTDLDNSLTSGIPMSIQRSRSPSPTHMMRQPSHSRAGSAHTLGMYRVGGQQTNNTRGIRAVRSRNGKLPDAVFSSEEDNHPAEVEEDDKFLETSMGNISIARGPRSSRQTMSVDETQSRNGYAPMSSPSSVLSDIKRDMERSAAARSAKVDNLNEYRLEAPPNSAPPRSDSYTSPSVQSPISPMSRPPVSHHRRRSSSSNSAALAGPQSPATPSRRQRTSSLPAGEEPDYRQGKDPLPPVEKAKRRLASSRRLHRADSSSTSGTRASLDIEY